jgi:putative PIN family toxin of toxin-antitoxin system
MKIVLDTNVLMSALFFGGLAEKLVNLVLLNIITAVASEEILREYEDTTRDMLQKTRRKEFKFSFVSLIEHLEIIEPQSNIQICRDPDDDKFINCASELFKGCILLCVSSETSGLPASPPQKA